MQPPLVRTYDLPASVAEELSQLQSIVSDSDRLSAFQAKLPSSVVTGSIAIHHTSEYADTPFEAHACYDALVKHGVLGVYQCFLVDGTLWNGYVWPPS